jgi:alkylation response protein AidB-like acyl-CoA dehydrogenase
MLEFTDEQKGIQSAIRSWCRTVLEPKVPALEAGTESVYPVMRAMGAAFGFAELAEARFAAAAARDAREASGEKPSKSSSALTAILMMELSRVCPGFAMALGATIGLFGGAVMSKGTPEQRLRWALPAFKLETVGAWALTEPGAGSDAFGSMKTLARPDGTGFRLTGSKTFISNAPFADVMVVYARLKDDAGERIAAFIVERGDPGVALGPPLKKMGMCSSPTGEIFLDDVPLAEDRLLGGRPSAASAKGSDGRSAAKSSLQGERFGMTPMCLGIVDRCLEESIRYAREREQWGRPIATFQLVQEKIARIYQARTIMMTLLLRQLESEAKGVALSDAEASAGKLYCAQSATACALEAVQIMGGAGYMSGSVVEMLARDAKLFQIGGGTDEVQILRIARELLAAP